MERSEILAYYRREDIQAELLVACMGREVGVRYLSGSFGARPEIVQFGRDLASFAAAGASSFHISEERWSDPLALKPGMSSAALSKLRTGWDLFLDIDCPDLELSTLTAVLLLKALRREDVRHASVKFSGNHGWHIGLPFEAFPKKIKLDRVIETKTFFPEGVRLIANYLQERIAEPLARELAALELQELAARVQKSSSSLLRNGMLDPRAIITIDSAAIAPRHLFRAPYALNEKAWLVSLPIRPDELADFDPERARPERVDTRVRYLDSRDVVSEEASQLFDNALAWRAGQLERSALAALMSRTEQAAAPRIGSQRALNATDHRLWPPCITRAMAGLADGRKRALFVLTNFFRSLGLSKVELEQLLAVWNSRNAKALPPSHLASQLGYAFRKPAMPPPNCRRFYEDIGLCAPDALCARIKNPLVWARARAAAGPVPKESKTPFLSA